MDPISMQSYNMNNILRISGLASGLDTDTMVKQLMQAQSIPLDQLGQQKQWLEWQQEDLRDINTKLLSLRDNNLFQMKLQSSYLAKTVSSDNSIATATAGGNVVNGTYKLVVSDLATAATVSSSTVIDAYDSSTSTYKPLISANTTYNLNLNNTEITLGSDKDWTINDIVSAINDKSSTTHVTATYDPNLDRLFLVNSTTGSSSKIDFSGTDTQGQDFLTNTLKLDLVTNVGQDASFSFNDVSVTSSTNSVSIAGININLTGLGTTSLSVQTDTDTIYNNIKNFVDAYNDIITTINSKLSEKRNYDYPPLTDAQKQSMKDNDITLWEQKARSGDLTNDTNLESIYNSMRSAVSSFVNDTNGSESLSSIGITTGQWYEGGKLYIDDSKLKSAIQNNPQEVMNIFTKVNDYANPGANPNDGIASKLYYAVDNGINSLTQEAGGGQFQLYDNSYIGNQINDLNNRMSDMQDHLNTLEQQYYAEFTQLETYMSQMNSQSSWLSQQISGASN